MNPEGKKNVFKTDKIYVRPVGAPEDAPWEVLDTTNADWEPTYPLAVTLEELRTITFPGTETLTYTFKMTKLEYRAFMRLFGIKVPSLIHNGKKRRK